MTSKQLYYFGNLQQVFIKMESDIKSIPNPSYYEVINKNATELLPLFGELDEFSLNIREELFSYINLEYNINDEKFLLYFKNRLSELSEHESMNLFIYIGQIIEKHKDL